MRARLIDPGAVFAGWIGLAMALVVVIAFALIIPIQTLVFVLAPLSGVVIGVYANVRSERWRPRARVLANAAWAGLVSGVGLAVLYVVIRLVFIYGDSGYPIFNRTDPETGRPIPPFCQAGPDCIYQRYVEVGQQTELRSMGITEGLTLEAALWRELIGTGTGLVLLAFGGAIVGGVGRTVAPRPTSLPLPSATRPAGST